MFQPCAHFYEYQWNYLMNLRRKELVCHEESHRVCVRIGLIIWIRRKESIQLVDMFAQLLCRNDGSISGIILCWFENTASNDETYFRTRLAKDRSHLLRTQTPDIDVSNLQYVISASQSTILQCEQSIVQIAQIFYTFLRYSRNLSSLLRKWYCQRTNNYQIPKP